MQVSCAEGDSKPVNLASCNRCPNVECRARYRTVDHTPPFSSFVKMPVRETPLTHHFSFLVRNTQQNSLSEEKLKNEIVKVVDGQAREG